MRSYSAVRVFVTESFLGGKRERAAVKGVLDTLISLGAQLLRGRPERRLGLLESADAVIMIRTGPSEAGALEAARNLFAGPKAPLFLAVWKGAGEAPWSTVLHPEVSASFSQPEELRPALEAFLRKAAASSRRNEQRMIRLMETLVA